MKCPACKMETPEELGYCDFCKEPFRRKPPAPEPKPAAKVEGSAREKTGGIPPEFAALDAGERIPELPPVARKLAWAFLAIVVFWTGVGLYLMMTRVRRVPLPLPVMAPPASPESPAPSEQPSPEGVPVLIPSPPHPAPPPTF